MPQLRDKLIFAFGVCTLARSSELSCLRVEDLSISGDGIVVSIHRKKACASRSDQTIWVCGSFFDWNLLDNLHEFYHAYEIYNELGMIYIPNIEEREKAASDFENSYLLSRKKTK